MPAFTHLTTSGNGNDAQTFTTASVTPPAGTTSVLLALSWASQSEPEISGLGLTWTRLHDVLVFGSSPTRYFAAFVGTGTATAGTVTFSNPTHNVDGIAWSLAAVTGGDPTNPAGVVSSRVLTTRYPSADMSGVGTPAASSATWLGAVHSTSTVMNGNAPFTVLGVVRSINPVLSIGSQSAATPETYGVMTGSTTAPAAAAIVEVQETQSVPVSATKAVTWNSRSAVSRSGSQAWSVRSVMSKATATLWSAKRAALATKQTSWPALSAVTSSHQQLWRVEEPIFSVLRQNPQGWSVLARLQKATATRWGTRAAISDIQQSFWSVRSQAPTVEAEDRWSVLAPVGPAELAAGWSIIAHVDAAVRVRWRVQDNRDLELVPGAVGTVAARQAEGSVKGPVEGTMIVDEPELSGSVEGGR